MDTGHYPVLDTFIDYMESKWQGNLGVENLEWLEALSTDETLFLSFVFASTGAWGEDKSVTERVGEEVLASSGEVGVLDESDSEVVNSLSQVLSEVSSEYSDGDWIHSHRFRPIRRLGSDWNYIAEYTLKEWGELMNSGNFESPSEWLQSYARTDSDVFYKMFKDLGKLDQWGRVTQFDCLEIANRAGGIRDLRLPPEGARIHYVWDSYPMSGFMIVFCSEEATVEAAEKARGMGWRDAYKKLDRKKEEIDPLLRELAKYLSDRGWNEDTIVYDLESCFCIFDKEDDYRNWLSESAETTNSAGC